MRRLTVSRPAMRTLLNRLRDDSGMNTAEYAVGTLAAVAFAGLLLKVVTSDTVQQALTRLFERALG
jgi:Flp pilus assembly pilin Flp